METDKHEVSNDGASTQRDDTPSPPLIPPRLSLNARAFSIDALLSPSTSSTNMTTSTSFSHTAVQLMDDSDSSQEEDVLDVEGDDSKSVPNSELVREDSVEPDDLSSDVDDNTELTEDICEASPSLEKTQCILEMTELWKKFFQLGTEMIITKSGRRMFPSLRVSFTGLDPKAHYQVYFDIAPVDKKRYRYAYHRSSWLVAGRADPPIPRRCYTHPDGPFRGDSLQKQSLSFEKVKLTNNLHDKWGYIILNSMHKYQPRIHLVKYEDKVPIVQTISDLQNLDRKVFVFTETQFIGVTAYQNQLITKLKIDSNPFAKGFRDSARITQIDRESVDLLIKASRHGYTPSMLPHPMLANMTLPSPGTHTVPGFPTKFNPAAMLPGLPFPGLFTPQPNMPPKEFMQFYLEQLSAASSSQSTLAHKSTVAAAKCITNRYTPYHR